MYDSLGEYNQAKELHKKALSILKTIFGEDHTDIATSYNNFDSVYDTLGEYNQAKELQEKALTIRKKIFGEDHADVAKAIRICHQCTTAWENTIKPKNFTKKH